MRTGGGLRVILDGEERELAVAHPFDRSIVEVQMGDFKAARPGNAVRIANHREAMVLRGDEDLTRADFAVSPPKARPMS